MSVNSRLYEKHPDWAAAVPDRNHSEGRNQRILDLANPQVQEFVIEEMSRDFFQCGYFLCQMGHEPDFQ